MTGRIATAGAAVATLGLIAAVVYYGSQPEYGVLFADLKPSDAQTIVEKLKAANVPYSISSNGTTVQVPADKISELRLQMASAGVLSGGHVGFDLFDKTSFGTTDFAQQVNYRRAIEGELAKTLEGMDEVEQARVHLTPKRESVYTEKEEGAKASVMLRVKQGKELSNERTDAIVNLIASAVEGLDPSGISVMDTRGRLLTAAGRGGNGSFSDAGAFHAQLEAKQKFESETAARIVSLLEPITGEGHVRADVAADVDFSKVEQTEEKYDPNSKVIRTQENTQETRNSNVKNPAGVVGARANDPTAAPVPSPTPAASPGAATTAAQTGDTRSSHSETNEIDRTVKKTVGGTGRVNRMTVSVLVDHKNVEGVATARTPEEIKQIQELVAAAVGTDNARGDVVVVQTMPFDKPQLDGATSNASWLDRNKQLVSNAIKYGTLIAIALLLLIFVVRPARRALLKAAAPPVEAKLLTAADEADESERRLTVKETQNALTEGENPLPQLEPMMTVAELEAKMQAELEKEVTTVNAHAKHAESIKKTITEQTLKDPEAVVSTLRGWLRESQG